MKIIDSTPAFFQLFDEQGVMTINKLNHYYAQYPELFAQYFERHCPRTEERLTLAIERYPAQRSEAKKVVDQLPAVIEEVMHRAVRYFGFELDLEFYLLVGGFGSNAYVDLKKGVYFAVEKLSSDLDHLHIIVAHEVGHLYHLALLSKAGIDWKKVPWDGFPLSNWEGVATYISQQLVPNQPQGTYLTYDNDGETWMSFYQQHRREIAAAFLTDLTDWSFEKEREWFRLSGGAKFGYNRLGYLVGTDCVNQLVMEHGEEAVLTLLAREEMRNVVGEWLQRTASAV